MKSLLVGITFSLVLVLLSSCIPAQTITVTTMVTQVNDTLNSLQADFDNLQTRYQAAVAEAQTQTEAVNNTLTELQSRYDNLQQVYDTMVENTGQTDLRDPSWVELKEFVIYDDVDTVPYNLNTFACSGYAIILRDRARKLGIRSAFVQASFPGTAGHALTAFRTTDKGLIFIDCAEGDKVAYVTSGQPYGTIQISAVRSHYIDCSMPPDSFWQPLRYMDTDNPFTYDYYLGYQQRWDFFKASVTAYNQVVAEFNAGRRSHTQSEMTTWQKNLDALESELGNIVYESPGITGNIEIYWGDNP